MRRSLAAAAGAVLLAAALAGCGGRAGRITVDGPAGSAGPAGPATSVAVTAPATVTAAPAADPSAATGAGSPDLDPTLVAGVESAAAAAQSLAVLGEAQIAEDG